MYVYKERLTAKNISYKYKRAAKWGTANNTPARFVQNNFDRLFLSLCFDLPFQQLVIARRSRRDIVLAASVHTFCLSGTISQYLLVRFGSLVQMISTMDSRYPTSLVKIDHLTLELLPLFSICNYKAKPILTFFVWWSSHLIKAIIFNNFSL